MPSNWLLFSMSLQPSRADGEPLTTGYLLNKPNIDACCNASTTNCCATVAKQYGPSFRKHAAMPDEQLVSVVTPFYNTVDYLAECIESVLGQTYQNFEFLLVNNCSNDGSLEIAQKFASLDRRIRLHNNADFRTQVANYNGALELISPESRYTKIV